MEAEVIQMTVNLFGGDANCCGALTSGGTESLVTAILVYKNWARKTKGITRPNL